MRWMRYAELCAELGGLLGRMWSASMPAPGDETTPVSDAECDDWCRRLAADVENCPAPPDHVQPWILARLAAAAATSHRLADTGARESSLSTRETLQYLLVDAWHLTGRQLWAESSQHPGFSE